jgi:hypothetical protein
MATSSKFGTVQLLIFIIDLKMEKETQTLKLIESQLSHAGSRERDLVGGGRRKLSFFVDYPQCFCGVCKSSSCSRLLFKQFMAQIFNSLPFQQHAAPNELTWAYCVDSSSFFIRAIHSYETARSRLRNAES